MNNTLYIVVPCYNEEAVLTETTKRLTEKLTRMVNQGLISSESRICYVDDGSRDKTWELIEKLNKENSLYMELSALETEVIRMLFSLVL